MLKNKHSEYKLAKKKKIPAPLLGVLIGISAFAALSGTDYAVSYYQGENYMPYSEVVQFCDELDVNMSYFTYETSPKKQNTRAVFPKDGIKLNIFMKNLTEEQKNDMQRVVDDLNAIFQVIRPANKFILDFNPSLGDQLDKYNIDVYEMPEDIMEGTGGRWLAGYQTNNKNGRVSYQSKIEIKLSELNYHSFMHEIFHHLGLGDAYDKLDELDSYSIMMGTSLRSKHIHKNDLAILVARYGDYSTPEKKQALIEYINNYESQQDWYKEYKEKADELVDKLATSLNIDKSEINFDLSGKTYIAKHKGYIYDQAYYDVVTFNKQKMVEEDMKITMQVYTNDIKTSYNHYEISQFMDDIDGINFTETVLGETIIYCEVDGTLYQVGQTPPMALGKIASPQEIKEYEDVKQRWQNANNSLLTCNLVDELYEDVSNYIPKVDKKITSADNLKLYNEVFGEFTIGKNSVTINNKSYAFEYYKGGIFIPTAQHGAIFIFPDENDTYCYIKATRTGSKAKYTFSTLEPVNKTSSLQSHDVVNDSTL